MGNAATERLGGRLLAVSDIHGYGEGLRRLLQLADYKPQIDRLLLLGDYIDADKPATWPTLDLVYRLTQDGARALAGNHELKFAARAKRERLANDSRVNWVRSLPLYIAEETLLFVHAGLRPGLPLHAQSVRDLTEIREPFFRHPVAALRHSLRGAGDSGAGLDSGNRSVASASGSSNALNGRNARNARNAAGSMLAPSGVLDTARGLAGSGGVLDTARGRADADGVPWQRIVFGHTATYKLGAAPGAIWSDGFRIAIDTGAKHGLRLTLVDFTGKLAYSCATAPGYGCGDFRTDDITAIWNGAYHA